MGRVTLLRLQGVDGWARAVTLSVTPGLTRQQAPPKAYSPAACSEPPG